eukprot:TRINITY_DN1944_c0_g1_i15.p1 TRINITY_DN1944_c0_g1~~TRINITY_DN1944_c0_g1_i15.p1  ORF type:complete len:264 (+),score=-17.77 TRINITY_DN1944_c0_g1_i15:25-816(+)
MIQFISLYIFLIKIQIFSLKKSTKQLQFVNFQRNFLQRITFLLSIIQKLYYYTKKNTIIPKFMTVLLKFGNSHIFAFFSEKFELQNMHAFQISHFAFQISHQLAMLSIQTKQYFWKRYIIRMLDHCHNRFDMRVNKGGQGDGKISLLDLRDQFLGFFQFCFRYLQSYLGGKIQSMNISSKFELMIKIQLLFYQLYQHLYWCLFLYQYCKNCEYFGDQSSVEYLGLLNLKIKYHTKIYPKFSIQEKINTSYASLQIKQSEKYQF